MQIETPEHAPDFMKVFATTQGFRTFQVMLVARDYRRNDNFGILRDRSQEYACMLVGFGGDVTHTYRVKGAELRACGWDIVGAAISNDYVVMVRV